MKRGRIDRRLFLATASSATAGFSSACYWALSRDASEPQWIPLFNGKDLSGWKEISKKPGAWKVEDGILRCSGGEGGWLSTDKEFSDFELSLEFRLPQGGNSGVFLRHPGTGDGAYTGMEIQVLDDYAKQYDNLRAVQYTGSIYDVQAAAPGVTKKEDPEKWKDRATKPAGQWQKMDILCVGRKVKISINGRVVVDANLDDYPDKVAKHPGLKRTSGFIGLQNHGSGVDYRNIRIRPIPSN
ncbi:MAG: DUF1080 domain-containing protein [Candidatus Sumerlaeia bacterium]|nr:DUF1080 domain-containing protein [Candidatus Sumerlaeia bacterium]